MDILPTEDATKRDSIFIYRDSRHVSSCGYSNDSQQPWDTQNLLAPTLPGQCQGWGMLAGFAESQQLQLSLCCWLWVLAVPGSWQSPAPHHPVLCSGVELPPSLRDQSPLPVWTCSNESQQIPSSPLLAVNFYKLKEMGFPLELISIGFYFLQMLLPS